MSPHTRPHPKEESPESLLLPLAVGVGCGALALHWYARYWDAPDTNEADVLLIERERGVIGWE